MGRRTRRQFLEDSMFAAAAAVASSAPSQLLAGAGGNRASAAERLTAAVVGVRGRGSSHLRALAARADVRVGYVCDVDHQVAGRRAAEVARRQRGRGPKVVEDVRRVLDDPAVDVVVIATPDHLHALQAIWALQAGKDVYLERPVSHTISEGRRIVQAARRSQRICQAGLQARSHPGMIEAIRFLRSGGIGTVRIARGLCYRTHRSMGPPGCYEPPPGINYDLWLGPAAEAPPARRRFHFDWRWQWAYGSGDLGSDGIQPLDLARWGLGQTALSRRVLSVGGRFGAPDAGQTPNVQLVVYQYDQQQLSAEVRALPRVKTKGGRAGVIFEGTDGFLVLTTYFSGAAFDRQGNMIRSFAGRGSHLENFLQAVRSRSIHGLHADIEEGHLSSALCHMANISYRLGRAMPFADAAARLRRSCWQEEAVQGLERMRAHLEAAGVDLDATPLTLGRTLRFDPQTETFDDPAANALLAGHYRPPFLLPEPGVA